MGVLPFDTKGVGQTLMPSCVFLNAFYDGFLKQVYANESLVEEPYATQLKALNYPCFGDSDFYSTGLAKAGFETWDFVINCAPSQIQWAREHGMAAKSLFDVIEAQVEHCSPDVVYIQDLNVFSREHIEKLKRHTKLVVGQIASPISDQMPIDLYDLIVSCCPHFVERFRAQGVRAEYQPLAFDFRVNSRVGVVDRDVELSFVGGITSMHSKGHEFLTVCADALRVDIWGYGAEALPEGHPIGRYHHGAAFGIDFFKCLARSKVTLNRHIDIAENYACNMRMYEATGCGALLITDAKDNLGDLFDVGKEVLAYSSPEEAVELAKYYMAHSEEAGKIARAGQARTLKDHSYQGRMVKTGEWLTSLLS